MPSRLCPCDENGVPAEAVTVNSVTISAYSAAVYAPQSSAQSAGSASSGSGGKRLFFGFGVRRLLTGSGSPRRAAHRAAAPPFFMPCKSAAPPAIASGGLYFSLCALMLCVQKHARLRRGVENRKPTWCAGRRPRGALMQYICPRHGGQNSRLPTRPGLR